MSCELSKQSYLDSYNVAVDTLKRENPVLSSHEIRMKAALQFRPIFHAMEAVSAIENVGEQEYENGGFALTPEGEMYFLNTGQKADQLHMNQRRSSELTNDPTKYSVTDHQTTRLIQYAIAHGATVVRTSFARDGQNNRDIVEYQYDRLTNRGVIKVINTADNGVQHDFNSIKEIARQRSQHLIEVAPLENVFIFTDAQLRQDRARAVVLTSRGAQPPTVRSIQPESQKQSFPTHEAFIREEVRVIDGVRGNMFVDTSRIVFHDSREAIGGIADFLRNMEKRKEVTDRLLGLSIVQKIRRIFEKGDQVIDNNNAAALLLSINQKSEEGALHPKVQPERLTIEKIREKPVRTVEIIRKQHEEMKKGIAVLGMIAETGVAIHAATVILSRLKEKLPTPVVAIKKSIERHEKKELRKKKKAPVKVQSLKTERVEPLRRAKERKRRKKRSKEKGIKRIAAASEIIPSASKKRERREKRKMRQAVEKSLRRYKKKELKREIKKDSVRVQPLIETKRSIQRKEREAMAGIVFGWMMWMILTRKDSETPKNNFKRSHPALQGETLRRQEVTLWILLSIIYYLTAIREQGMQSNPTNTTRFAKARARRANNPMKKRKILLPQYAVIFAYNS